MKRRSFLGALAALVAAPKALLALDPTPRTPDVFDSAYTEFQAWHGGVCCEQAIWHTGLTPEQERAVEDYLREKYGEPLDGVPMDIRWTRTQPPAYNFLVSHST
jgi:hypothetical protein